MKFKILITFFYVYLSRYNILAAAPTDNLQVIPDNTENSPPQWSAHFSIKSLNMTMTKILQIELQISDIPIDLPEQYTFQVLAEHVDLVHVISKNITQADIERGSSEWKGNVTLEALFLGQTKVYVILMREPNILPERAGQELHVIIVRNTGPLDTAFFMILGCFVMLLYVSFGVALDPDVLKQILLRPVGPGIGIITKFFIMPILGYFIGYYIFHDQVDLRLGLFFTSVTPAGGSSNVFTALLDGNLNLSVTMTALSNLAAVFMMPIWIYTLGALIFHDGHFIIPYVSIATTSVSLMVPLCMGIILQRYKPGYVSFVRSYLKTFSFFMFFLFGISATWINRYMFKLFSSKIIFATATLSWSGYFFGWLMGTIFKQTQKDALTIGIETGIENTAIAIFMLNVTLPQPSADITSAVPVANAVMTPLPLIFIYVLRRVRCRQRRVGANSEVKGEAQLASKGSDPTPNLQLHTHAETKEVGIYPRVETIMT